MPDVQPINPTEDAPASKSIISIRLGGVLLLLLQAALLLGLCWYLGQSFEGSCNGQAVEFVQALDCENLADEDALVEVFLFLLIYLPVALLACVAAITFLFLRGWLLALAAQGLSLFLALLFFGTLPTLAHLAMLTSIFMVLYLNSYNVRATFDH